MGYGHSLDFRRRIIEAVRDGSSARGAACRFGVCVSSAITLVSRWRETGSYAPGQAGGQKQRKSAGAYLLYLPPYSPDLNPIELAFSKLKALLRKAAARAVDDLWDAIADLIDEISPQECVNFFRHAGYDQNQS